MPASRPSAARSGFAEQHGADHQQRQHRQRQEQVGEAHQRAVEAAEVAGQHAHYRADGQRQGHRGHAHGQRQPAAGQQAGEGVAAQVVGAERVGERHALVLGPVVEVVRIDAVHERAEQHRQRDRRKHRGASDGAGMAAQPVPERRVCGRGRGVRPAPCARPVRCGRAARADAAGAGSTGTATPRSRKRWRRRCADRPTAVVGRSMGLSVCEGHLA